MLVSNPKFLQSSPSQGKSQSAWAACKWPDWWQSGSEAPWGRWPTHCRWPKEAHCWGDPNSSSHFNWWFPGGWCRTWWFHRISQKGQVWYLIIRSTIMSMLLLIFTNYFHFLPLKKNECVIITNLNTPEHIWFGMPFLVLKHWWNSTWDVPTCSGQQRTTRLWRHDCEGCANQRKGVAYRYPSGCMTCGSRVTIWNSRKSFNLAISTRRPSTKMFGFKMF